MTILAADAAESAGEATAGRVGGAHARSRAAQGAAQRNRYAASGRQPSYQPRHAGQPAGEAAAGGQSRFSRDAQRRAADLQKSYVAQTRALGAQAQVTGRRAHQGAILAEFVTAVALIAFAPIATGGSAAAQAKDSPSPYSVSDLRRLVAVGVVYFGLALIPGEQGSRVAAWLGGLVLLVIAMGMVSSGAMTSVVNIASGRTEAPAEAV